MAPKSAKAKKDAPAAPKRTSKRLAAKDAAAAAADVATNGIEASVTTIEPRTDDPEKLLRKHRRTKRNDRGVTAPPASRVASRAADATSTPAQRRATSAEPSKKPRMPGSRSSHHDTGQLHLPTSPPVPISTTIEHVAEPTTRDPISAVSPKTVLPAAFTSTSAASRAHNEGLAEEEPTHYTERSTEAAAVAPGLSTIAESGGALSLETEKTTVGTDGVEHREEASGKRGSKGQPDGERDAKRQKNGGDEQQDSARPARPRVSEASDPCRDYQAALQRLRADFTYTTDGLEDPVIYQQDLYQETLFRAIASVTEAIAENGGDVVSLVDPNTAGAGVGQGIARPNNVLYWPYVVGGRSASAYRTLGGHLGLFVFSNDEHPVTGTPAIEVERYDSARRLDPTAANSAYREARNILINRGWTWTGVRHQTAADFPESPETRPNYVQTTFWVCGLHTIFNAWAHALLLNLNDVASLSPRFYRDGVQIVNLALRGHMDSETIYNFLACHGFVRRGDEIPSDRRFGRTRAFLTTRALSQYVARVRLEYDLREMRLRRPSIPGLALALDLIEETGIARINEEDLVTLAAANIRDQYIQAQRIVQDPQPREAAPVEPELVGAPAAPPRDPADPMREPVDARPAATSGEGTGGTGATQLSETGDQEEIPLGQLIDERYDISGQPPEIQRLLLDAPIDRMDQIVIIVNTLPERSQRPEGTSGPAASGLLPGLGYDLGGADHARDEAVASDGIVEDAADSETPSWDRDEPSVDSSDYDDWQRRFDSPLRHASSTPGYDGDEPVAEYLPPASLQREPHPVDHETPVVDDDDLPDYEPSNPDLDVAPASAAEVEEDAAGLPDYEPSDPDPDMAPAMAAEAEEDRLAREASEREMNRELFGEEN